MIDLEELGRHKRLSRIYQWRLLKDPEFRAQEDAKAGQRRLNEYRRNKRNRDDLKLGIKAGDQVEIDHHQIFTTAGVMIDLIGTPAVVITLVEKPLGGYFAVVETQQEIAPVRRVRVGDLRAAHARGERVLGAVQRSAPRIQYQLPLSSLIKVEPASSSLG